MDKVKKHTIRVRYVILSVIGFVLAVIIGIVTIAAFFSIFARK